MAVSMCAQGEKRLWLGGECVTAPQYRARERAAKAWVRSLALNQSWVAERIGRTVWMVSAVLNERDPVPAKRAVTLALIEDLLRRVEAGEVIPE